MNDLMTTDRRERPAEAAAVAEVPAGSMTRGAAAGPGRGARVISLVRLHLLGLRGPLPFLLGLLLIMGAVSFVSGSIVPVSGFLTGAALAGGLSGVIAERSGINRLLASLPVSRAEVIDSYWAVAMLFVLAASALYAAIGLPLGVLPGDLLDVPLVLIPGQALGIPVFLHFGRGRGLHVWVIAHVVLGGVGCAGAQLQADPGPCTEDDDGPLPAPGPGRLRPRRPVGAEPPPLPRAGPVSVMMMGTTTGAAPDSSRGIGATAATGPAGPEGSGETALAGVGAVLRLDLIVLRRRGPLLLLPLALALYIAMDVLAGRLQTTVMAGVALGLCAQYAQRAVESAHHMERLYGALPLRRSELVGARWAEGVALALLSGLVCVPAAALTGDWGGLMAGLFVICLSAALGLPLFLCLAPERALWMWGLCLGAGAGALYGGTPLLAGPVAEVLREPVPAVLAALACPALLGASLVVALRWYGRQDH